MLGPECKPKVDDSQPRDRPVRASTPLAVLVSAYAARSHEYWAAGIVAHCPPYAWQRIALPPRHFAWRVRGSALALLDRRYDAAFAAAPRVLLATSMLDLATLRACRRSLRDCRCLVYFHENQFAYPVRDERMLDVQLLSIKTALAADGLAFNSAYNRATFFTGARALLARMPDAVPAGLLDDAEQTAVVLPVPLPAVAAVRSPARGTAGPLRILWNHRWEYDKAPERLLAALRALRARGVAFELALAGQRFRQIPAAITTIQAEFAAAIGHCGFIAAAADYAALLARCDVVVSTALHDFQGLAVQEAVAAGCLPVVPDRLAYRERFAAAYRYPSTPEAPEREALALAAHLEHAAAAKRDGRTVQLPESGGWTWSALAPDYRAWLAAVPAAGRP